MSEDPPIPYVFSTNMVDAASTTTNIKASHLDASTLPKIPRSLQCQAFVDGFCRRGHACQKSHEICAVDDDSPPKPRLNSSPNSLSLAPRLLPPDHSPFDDDGPGYLSTYGPRHDNDHVDIQSIQILPTTDEILSRRAPFMPRKSPHANHHLPWGQQRHLDTLFRQLRYDSVEPIIDVCYHANQQLARLDELVPTVNYEGRMITPRKLRYSLFHDVAFEDTMFNSAKGILIRVSFACPRALRGKRMGASKRFEEGMLVALIGLDKAQGLSTIFMEIFQRQTTDSMRTRTGNDLRGDFTLEFLRAVLC